MRLQQNLFFLHQRYRKLQPSSETELTLLQILSFSSNVIHALTSKSSLYIPFRNSTLTRILKESLGGNSKAALMVWVYKLSGVSGLNIILLIAKIETLLGTYVEVQDYKNIKLDSPLTVGWIISNWCLSCQTFCFMLENLPWK